MKELDGCVPKVVSRQKSVAKTAETLDETESDGLSLMCLQNRIYLGKGQY